jgi:hypothetical protein
LSGAGNLVAGLALLRAPCCRQTATEGRRSLLGVVRVLYIPLVNNAVRERDEWFDVELMEIDGLARLGPIMRSRLTIFDDH